MACIDQKMDNLDFVQYQNWLNTTKYTGPYGVTFKLYTKEGMKEQYKAAIHKVWGYELPPNMKKVEGLFEDVADDKVVWFLEKWSSPQACKQLWDQYKDDEGVKDCFKYVDGFQIAAYKLNEF